MASLCTVKVQNKQINRNLQATEQQDLENKKSEMEESCNGVSVGACVCCPRGSDHAGGAGWVRCLSTSPAPSLRLLPEQQSRFGPILVLLGAAGSLPSGSRVDGGTGSAFPISSAAELD